MWSRVRDVSNAGWDWKSTCVKEVGMIQQTVRERVELLSEETENTVEWPFDYLWEGEVGSVEC